MDLELTNFDCWLERESVENNHKEEKQRLKEAYFERIFQKQLLNN